MHPDKIAKLAGTACWSVVILSGFHCTDLERLGLPHPFLVFLADPLVDVLQILLSRVVLRAAEVVDPLCLGRY